MPAPERDSEGLADALIELGQRLDPLDRWTLVHIAGRMVDDGVSVYAAARLAGITKSEAELLLERLRDELAAA